MALQKAVNTAAALGVPGAKATPDQSIYTPVNSFAASGGVAAGSFAWLNASGELVQVMPSGATSVLGLVERDVYYPNYTITSDGSLVIPEGYAATVAVKGDYYAKVDASASVGAAVYAKAADGSVTLTSASNCATGWVVKTPAASGGIAIISAWK